MRTWNIDRDPDGRAVPPRARKAQWGGPGGWIAALLFAAVLAGWTGHRWHSGPERVGREFLAACESGDAAHVLRLLDAPFRRAVPPRELARLLRQLHGKVPRRFEVRMSGAPHSRGLVWNRRRFMMQVECPGAPGPTPRSRRFSVTLHQGADGSWRVAFLPTYFSMFSGVHGRDGEAFLYRTLAARLGRKSSMLARWREVGPEPVHRTH